MELRTFPTGAVRGTDGDGERFDLISPIALRRLARVYALGASRYGERNWEKGLPVSNLVNHAVRHIYLYLQGDGSEDHLAHAVWNLAAAMHMEELRPDCLDIPTRPHRVGCRCHATSGQSGYSGQQK